jgi:8-oxo-dGTP pyrophosphatase MutT (NUDIX family)
MSKFRTRESVGLFIISPTLDKVLVVEKEEFLDVPRTSRDRNESPFQAASRLAYQEFGIRISEDDFIAKDNFLTMGGTTFLVAMSGARPNSRIHAIYVPWRTLESSCENYLATAVDWAKEKAYT